MYALAGVLGVVLLGDGALLGVLGDAFEILGVSWKALGVVLAGLGGRHAHQAEKVKKCTVKSAKVYEILPNKNQRFTGALATFFEGFVGLQRMQ